MLSICAGRLSWRVRRSLACQKRRPLTQTVLAIGIFDWHSDQTLSGSMPVCAEDCFEQQGYGVTMHARRKQTAMLMVKRLDTLHVGFLCFH